MVSKRNEKDIWQHLYEFPLIESVMQLEEKAILVEGVKRKWIPKTEKSISFSPLFKQQLSHQLIQGRFITIKLVHKTEPIQGSIWMSYKKLKQIAFPRFIYHQLDIIFEEMKEKHGK